MSERDVDRSTITEELRRRQADLGRQSRSHSRWRLALFGGVVLGLLIPVPYLWGTLSLGSFAAFLFVFSRHRRVLEAEQDVAHEIVLNEEQFHRKTTRRRERSVPPEHPPANALAEGRRTFAESPPGDELDKGTLDDLDFFGGARSLFGFLDWCSTQFGSRRLAHILRHPLRDREAILARQEAVAELAGARRIAYGVLRDLVPLREKDFDPVLDFFDAPSELAGRRDLAWLAHLLGSIAPAIVVAIIITGNLHLLAFLFLSIAINIGVIGKFVRPANSARYRLLLFGPLIDAWLRIDARLAARSWQAPLWRQTLAPFHAIRGKSRQLRRWTRLLALNELGALFEILNALTLWELRVLPRACTLFDVERERLRDVLSALGEVEMLTCLALPLLEQEGFRLPECRSAGAPLLSGESVGHPLIDPHELVRNPVQLGSGATALLITGSNMAGKSTYLKSVGLNLALADLGAPVCATRFEWSPMVLISNMNAADSLDSGTSYFKAEAERVASLLKRADSGAMVLGLIDELFRGTNSDERLALSAAVVRHLCLTGTLVLVATHDLELARSLVANSGVRNGHFRETLEGNRMTFDYVLRDGIAPTRNAIRVLEGEGVPESVIREARAELAKDRPENNGRT